MLTLTEYADYANRLKTADSQIESVFPSMKFR
jgi:hypothetical protein